MSVGMRIVACVGVKDEADLIGPCITHLRAIGVGHIIVSDSGSTDGTLDRLASLAGPDLELRPYDDRAVDPDYEAAEAARIVERARALGADWLMFLDADEFPLPAGGRMDGVAGLATADLMQVDRFNVPLLAEGPAIALPPGPDAAAQTLLYAPPSPRAVTQARVRQDPDAPWIEVIPAPKVMIAPGRVDSTTEGHHDAMGRDGAPVRRLVPHDLVIAHVPFTTAARFATKFANMRALVQNSGHLWVPDSAWHWRRWLEVVDSRGGATGEVARNRISAEDLAALRAAGVVLTAQAVMARAAARLAAGNAAS